MLSVVQQLAYTTLHVRQSQHIPLVQLVLDQAEAFASEVKRQPKQKWETSPAATPSRPQVAREWSLHTIKHPLYEIPGYATS